MRHKQHTSNTLACLRTALPALAMLSCLWPALAAKPSSTTFALPAIQVPNSALSPKMTADAEDPAWRGAALIDSLRLCENAPSQGISPLPTQVRLLWTSNDLYIRFTGVDKSLFTARRNHLKNLYAGDATEVFIDPVGDSREFIELQVTPDNDSASVLHLLTTDAESGPDGTLLPAIVNQNEWDINDWNIDGLKTAASYDSGSGRWIIDISLPAKTLLKRLGTTRYAAGMTLRANFLRYDDPQDPTDPAHRQFIAMDWSPVAWGRPHRSPQRMGLLKLENQEALQGRWAIFPGRKYCAVFAKIATYLHNAKNGPAALERS